MQYRSGTSRATPGGSPLHYTLPHVRATRRVAPVRNEPGSPKSHPLKKRGKPSFFFPMCNPYTLTVYPRHGSEIIRRMNLLPCRSYRHHIRASENRLLWALSLREMGNNRFSKKALQLIPSFASCVRKKPMKGSIPSSAQTGTGVAIPKGKHFSSCHCPPKGAPNGSHR